MGVETRHIVCGGEGCVPLSIFWQVRPILQLHHSALIGHNLDRHRQIETLVTLVGRNVAVQIAALQFLIEQSPIFTAKENRHALGTGMRGNPLRAAPSILHWPGNAPLARTGTHHKLALGDGLLEGVNHACIFHHVDCGRGAPGRLRRRISLGSY